MTSKFENKNTVIRGIIANPETQTFEQFEITTDYVRSNERAIAKVREALNLNDNVMVSISELKQEEKRTFKWLVADLKAAFTPEYEQPEDVPENFTAISVTLYDYVADVFGYQDAEPIAKHVHVYGHAHKATKTDAREIVRTFALEYEGFTSVVCVAGCKRDESQVWFVVPDDEIEAYKKYDEK